MTANPSRQRKYTLSLLMAQQLIWVFQPGACLLRYSQQILDVLANAVESETVEIPVLKNATSMALYILKHLTLSLHLSLTQFHSSPML